MPSYSYTLLICSALAAVDAFAPLTFTTTRQVTPPAPRFTRRSKLFMSEEGGEETPAEGEESVEEIEEDPELKALKDEIAELEKTFGEKKSALEYALEQCEEYSKTGYARKVAEMENMRRVRSVSALLLYWFGFNLCGIVQLTLCRHVCRTLPRPVNQVPSLLS